MPNCIICDLDTINTCYACNKTVCLVHLTINDGHNCGHYRFIDPHVEQSLLNCIIATPDDDAPRLLYADWLMDRREEERGEWIIEHIAAYHKYKGKPLPNPVANLEQLKEFNDKYMIPASTWVQLWHGKDRPDFPNQNSIAHPYTMWAYERGFITTVWCSLEDWYKHGQSLVMREPIKRVNIVNKQPWGNQGQIRGWFVNGMLGPAYIGHPISPFLDNGKARYDNHISYLTRDSAMADLSKACIDWAKDRGGKPVSIQDKINAGEFYVPKDFVC